MQRYARPPALGQRKHLVVGGQDGVQVRRAAEERQRRQVGLPVPALRRRVDQPGPAVERPQHVARPEVAVGAGRRFARRVPVQGVDDLLDGLRRRPRTARRDRPIFAGTGSRRRSANQVPHGPADGVLSSGSGPMKPGQSAPKVSDPERCSAASSRPKSRGGGRRRRARRPPTPSPACPAARPAPRGSAPRRPIAASSDPAASASKKPARRRPGRPGLGEDRGAVVQGQAGCGAHVAARHRGLADALMGEKCRKMLGVRAQVRQIHGLIFHFGLRPSGIGVKMSA